MIFNFKTFLAGILTVAFSVVGTISFGQGTSCATSVPVTDLTGATCATATPSGVNTITPPAGCVGGSFDTWFSFVAQGGSATITVSDPIAGWRPEFIVASSSNNTCTGTFTAEQCFDQTGNYTSINGTINGLVIGMTYWIIVSSNGDETTGTISTCVNNPAVVLNCVDNDACVDAATLTLNAPGGAAACVADCNNGANPGLDFVGNVCEDMPNPTVWYEFTTASNAATIDVSLTSGTWTNPEFTIFVGNSCTSWTTLECLEGTGGAATSLAIPVSANTTYVIAVSDATGDQGTFNLCITQNPDNSACNTTDALTVSSTSMGSPLGGPYKPGEVVSFCYTITNWTQFNCNYIGAVVPTFGSCWDPASFNAQGMPVNITTPLNVVGVIQPCPPGPPCAYAACAGQPSGAWNWFTAGSATYNQNGYYPAGTPMPAGWYFLSSYNPATGACTGDPTDPDNSFGDGNFPACGTNTFDYTLCFSLIAGPAGNCGIGATDCSVSIKTFADGEFGAWNNLGCTGDIAATLPAGFVCCATIVDAGTDATICANSSTTLNGSYSGTTGAVTTTWTASPAGALAGLSSTTSLTPTFTPPVGITGPVTFTLSVTDAICTQTDVVVVTVNPLNTITAGSSQTVCVNSPITNITMTTTGATGATFSGLPSGVTGSWVGNTATISGTPTASGTFNYTVTTTGGCPPATTTGTITVNPINTITAGSNQTVCVNSALTNITMTTTGATGATFSGLPAGVTGSWSANTVTISGTPTASGTFNYTVTTTGGCPPATATGTITVTPLNTIAPGTSQTVCINSPITTINLATTGATGATFSGLPAGVTGSWAGNVATISGTPTASGVFNYTVTTTGGCPPATASGTITVNAQNTITAGSNQTVCINSALTNITMTTTGATGATFAGLPTGVSGSWAGNTVTISGTPSVSGTFNYTVTTTGGCPPATATGTITVTPLNTIAAGTSQTVCLNSPITTINLATTGATGATFAGLPAGVTGSWAGNTVTISGTPTASGVFNYSVTTTGGCPPATTTGTITVTPLNTIAAGTSQTVCLNSPITTINLATTGATGATFAGLPAGVIGSWAGNVVTISGTPTASGVFNYTVTTTGGCPPAITSGTITVTPLNTIAAGTSQTICLNSPITTISLATTGATGATFSGLPAGVTGSWAGNTVTISGTPTASGIFNYTVTTTGGCPPASTTGTITVTPLNTIAAGTSQTVCLNSAITAINLATTGATGATFSGLPAGVTGSWAGNMVTISGTPSASGVFNYTVTTTGGCPPASTSGTITVTPLNTITAGSNPTVCINSAMTNITMNTTGATGATFSGLPAGVSGSWAGNVATIFGTPTVSGVFNYSVTTTGGCPPATTSGTITVVDLPVISLTPDDPNSCNATDGFITVTGSGTGTIFWTGTTSGSQAVAAFPVVIPSLGSGSYNVYFVNSTGCQSTTISTTLNNPGAPIINPISNVNNCGTSYTLAAITGSSLVNPQYYTMSGGPATIGNTIVPVGFTYTAPANLTLYAYDQNGLCNTEQSFTIVINALPTVTSVNGGAVYCAGSPVSPITVSVTGTPNWSVAYTLNGVAQAPISSATSPISLGNSPGTYVVTNITDANCANTASGTQTITINALPTVTGVTGGAVYCAGDVISPINVAATGSPNWTVAYTLNGVAQAPVSSATSPISLGTAPGTYVVTNITDANCTNTASGTQTITINALPTVTSVTGGAIYCAGDVVAPIQVGVTGSANWSVSYTLNGIAQTPISGSTSPVSLGNTPGVYVVTNIADANCTNTASGTQTITINALPTATSVTGGGVYCAGSPVSPIQVAVTGAANWSIGYTLNGVAQTPATGSTSPISLGTAAGVYVITSVTDANCTNTAAGSQTITINPLPTVSSVTGGAVYCTGTPVSPVNVAVTGSPNWSIAYTLNGVAQTAVTGGTSPISLGTAPGTYVVTNITDANCTNTASGTQTITINALPTVTSVTGGGVYCTGDVVNAINVAVTGSPNWSVAYTLNGVAQAPIVGASSPISLGTATGNYVITSITDANCTNTASGTQTITVNTLPTVSSVSGGAVYCVGDAVAPINVAVTGTPNYSVSYTLNGVAQPNALSASSPISLGTAPGTYIVTGITDANCSNTAVGTQTITVNPLPTVSSVTGGAVYCAGDVIAPINVAVTGSANWSVSYTLNGVAQTPATGSASPVSLGTSAGVYVVTGVSDANCANSAVGSQTITINTLPTVTNVTGGASYCAGDAVSPINVAVTGTPSMSIAFTIDGVAQTPVAGGTSPISLGNAPGVYVVTGITDANCANTASGTQTITVNPLPTFTVSGNSPSTCNGTDGSIVISGLLNSTNYSVGYTDGATVIPQVSMTSSPSGTITIGSLDAGSYSNFIVTLISTGCTGTNSSVINLNNPGAPIITPVSNLTVCDSYILPTINGSGLTPGVGYWTMSGGSSTPGNISLSVGSSVTMSGTIYMYDISGSCSEEESFVVTVNNTPAITDPGDQIACDSYTLPTIMGSNLSPSTAYYSTQPFTSGNVIAGQITATQTVYIYSANGTCSDTVDFLVTINQTPELIVNDPASVCEPLTVDLTASAITAGSSNVASLSYWTDALATSALTSPATVSTSGMYYIQATNGGCTIIEPVTVSINPMPSAPTAGTDSIYCSSWDLVAMTASGNGGTLTWYSSSALTDVIGTGGSLMPIDAVGINSYYVTETLLGCEGPSAMVTITIENCEIIIPTAFTPDGDAVNDIWEIVDLDAVYPDNVVMVFNRWGNLLYESEQGNYSGRPWDGTYEGSALPVGSYYFVIDLNVDGEEPRKGVVSIILNK